MVGRIQNRSKGMIRMLWFEPKVSEQNSFGMKELMMDAPDSPQSVGGSRISKAACIASVARNFETCRGFHAFMRCLPQLLQHHPGCQVLIVGGDEVSHVRAGVLTFQGVGMFKVDPEIETAV